MDNLLVSALHSAATDSIAQPQILVIAHAPGILTVVADERLQTLAQFRGFRPQAFQGGDHLLHLAGPQVFGNLMNPPEHHTRLFCHPTDVSNPIQVHHLTKAGELHAVMCSVPRGNGVWAALRAFWAALTSYRADLRYPLFWQGLESLFTSETKAWKVTERLCTRLSFFLADNAQTQQDLFDKAALRRNVWNPAPIDSCPMIARQQGDCDSL